jgi:hypothetical protein
MKQVARLSETQIQRACFEHLRIRGAPGVFAFHPANGGFRRPVEAAILKGMGVISGTPDIIAIHQGRCFALELKAEGGRATDKQLACIAAMRAAGAITAIAVGLDHALATLENWGLLRKAPLTASAPRPLQEVAAAPTCDDARQLCFDWEHADERELEQIQDSLNEK